MNVDHFYVRLSHKSYRFIRTESRFFEVSGCMPDDNGLISDAVPVPDSTVADIVAQASSKQKTKGKASRIRRFRKEEAV